MVFVDVGLVGLLLGRLLGGRLVNLAETRIVGKGFVFAALALQVAAFPSGVLPWSTPGAVARGLWVGSYALLVLALVRNRALPGVLVVAAGVGCNLTAVLANGGLMPVRPSALAAAGLRYHVHNNSIDLSRPRLAFLTDRWAAPHWLPLANVFSVGDVLIGLGTLIAVVVAMRSVPPAPLARGALDRADCAPASRGVS